ncbi:polysaccharide lyase family 8 super-sandwich domain-containing protein [Bacteroides sp. 224]|uniref:polysaccharide lyase family 8 super-sandwich domain-containing protein n=1 Tax=Bacteroides sp. 224 TaxID=2302936 RepID=UPI0013D37FEF|nr:polysaccharide lyase family 8 super-sandwich domain-containing protein [Bacteroides sp. 224]NDV65238.1 chondroitinase [Bacteroides sp. 224]
MNFRRIPFILTLLFFAIILKAAEADELQKIRENYIRSLISFNKEPANLVRLLTALPPETEISDQAVTELHQRYPFNVEKITSYMKEMRPNGSWSDINYEDKKRSGWEPKIHAERILEMTKLYRSKQTDYYQSPWVEETIHKALNFWFITKPMCLNWWQNQIGIPKTLGGAFLLFEDKLNPEEKEGAIAVMSHARFGMTGQNKVWLAGNVMIRALLQNNFELVREARDIIASEIVTGQTEGIKEDWSFHQHGPQQQFGNYGMSFISGMSFFSGVFSGTSLAFSNDQLNILCSLLEKGYRWILWNGYMDISSLGRQLFHNAQIHKGFSVAFAAAGLANSGFPEAKTISQEIENDNYHSPTSGNPFTGHKYFPNSLYSTHRTPKWMTSLKMSSKQVIGTELVNEDNLKGYYMGDGATYFYIRGDEYLNDFPFWDWRKVPGVTAYENTEAIPRKSRTQNRNNTDFVGGVTDGKYGLAVMDLDLDGLRARKTWIFTDKFVLCLGRGIQSDSTLTVTTAIDQRGKQGALSVLNGKQWEAINGNKTFTSAQSRFFHDNTGYIVLGKSKAVATSENRSGQWHDFMQMYRPKLEEKEMIMLHLDHGASPKKATYQYLVLPGASQEETAGFDVSSIQFMKDDKTALIVSVPAIDSYFIVAYKPFKFNYKKGHTFKADAAGIYLITGNRLHLPVLFA